jgi:hypothetical protein
MGADSPLQKSQVEWFNDTKATIIRTLLYGANLPAKYWSVAAVHAVFFLNRRVHSALDTAPYEAWWDHKPELSALKVFGSRVCVKLRVSVDPNWTDTTHWHFSRVHCDG